MSEQAPAPIAAPVTPEVQKVPNNDTSGTQSKTPEANPTAAEIKKWKIKADGKEEEIDEKELVRRASLSTGAQKRMQEAADLRKKMAALVEGVKKNPVESLFDPALGLTKEQIQTAFEDWYKREVLEPETLTPEQKRLRQAEGELKQLREKAAGEAKEREAEQMAKLQAETRSQYDKQIFEALEAAKLPKKPFTVKRTAYYMYQALERGIDAPLEAITKLVKQDYQDAQRELYENADIETLVEMLGENFFNRLRKHDVEKLKTKITSTPTVAAPKIVNPRKDAPKPNMMKVRNYFDNVK